MKAISCLVAILFTALLGKAQSFPFPDSAATWVNASYQLYPFPTPHWEMTQVPIFMVNGQDTSISGSNYTKMEHYGHGYKGALRSDSGRVYYVPKDSLQEFLLYDFTLNVGDTAFNVYYEIGMYGYGQLADIVVDQTWQASNLNGRKVLAIGDGILWFEGIGSERGLLSEPFGNVSNYSSNLECFSHLDTTRFPWQLLGPDNCDLTLNIPTGVAENLLLVHPNPATDRVTVRAASFATIQSLTLMSMDGRTVLERRSLNETSMELYLGDLCTGTYILNTRTNQGVSTKRIVVHR